jgi:hypothetical protein
LHQHPLGPRHVARRHRDPVSLEQLCAGGRTASHAVPFRDVSPLRWQMGRVGHPSD